MPYFLAYNGCFSGVLCRNICQCGRPVLIIILFTLIQVKNILDPLCNSKFYFFVYTIDDKLNFLKRAF